MSDLASGGIDGGGCGHCSSDAVETQGHCVFCYNCGKFSTFDGQPIQGNAHFRANYSTTLPDANKHGIAEFL